MRTEIWDNAFPHSLHLQSFSRVTSAMYTKLWLLGECFPTFIGFNGFVNSGALLESWIKANSFHRYCIHRLLCVNTLICTNIWTLRERFLTFTILIGFFPCVGSQMGSKWWFLGKVFSHSLYTPSFPPLWILWCPCGLSYQQVFPHSFTFSSVNYLMCAKVCFLRIHFPIYITFIGFLFWGNSLM